MVQSTIAALLAIKSTDDEILIIDNNHSDESLYRPLEAYCASLDKALNVRFFHEDHIDGFKAGALNYALEVMDKQCDYIVVVDSDYQALPWARKAISTAINQYPHKTLLQFPQFYRDEDKPDIHTELNHYFSYLLSKPFNAERTLSTGTFAVIKREDIVSLGGWSGESITEDAQMGVIMHMQGLQTQYVRQIIATGILPCNLADLIAQRQRWIYGNMQVLKGYAKLFWRNRYLIYKKLNEQKYQTISSMTESRIFQPTVNNVINDDRDHSLLSVNDDDYDTDESYRFDKEVANYGMSKTFGIRQSDKFSSHTTVCNEYKEESVKDNNALNHAREQDEAPLILSGFSLTPSTLLNERQYEVSQYLRAHLSQLSAWVNFTGLFIVAHAIALALIIAVMSFNAVQMLFIESSSTVLAASWQQSILSESITVISICYIAYFIYMGRRLFAYLADSRPLGLPDIAGDELHQSKINTTRNPNSKFIGKTANTYNQTNGFLQSIDSSTPISKRVRAWLIHLSFWELGALSWLPVLWGREKPFVNTPKIDTQNGSTSSKRATLTVMPKLLVGLNLLTVIVITPVSIPLALYALIVLTVKLLSAYVMVENFDN